MRKMVLVLLLAAMLPACNKSPKQLHVGKVKEEPVPLHSVQGMKRFQRSHYKIDFFKLANQFEPQMNPFYCGPTSVAIVLNALRIDKLRKESIRVPLDKQLLDRRSRKYLNPNKTYVFNRYTQNNVFDIRYRHKSRPIEVKSKYQTLGEPIAKSNKPDWGFQVRQLHELFLAHGTQSQLFIVDGEMESNDIRSHMTQSLRESDNYIVVNYRRDLVDQGSGVHISPVAAYDRYSDSLLVLDTNPQKNAWVWINTSYLIAAMRTYDTIENRGYILVSD